MTIDTTGWRPHKHVTQHPDSGLWTAGIDIPIGGSSTPHYNAIECHATTRSEAVARVLAIMDAMVSDSDTKRPLAERLFKTFGSLATRSIMRQMMNDNFWQDGCGMNWLNARGRQEVFKRLRDNWRFERRVKRLNRRVEDAASFKG